MSAIWGLIDFHKGEIKEETKGAMEEPFHSCVLDKINTLNYEGIYLGAGLQYFTKEAEYEVQPLRGEEDFFLADAVLDNREELLEELKIDPKEGEGLPDGTLMYQFIKEHGRKSFFKFLGTYAFVHYDSKRGEALLVSDCVGSRCLYYHFYEGRLYFSTLINPILKAKGGAKELNYRFLCDYLALDDLSLYTEEEETPYLGIYKVAPGQIITVNKEGIKKESYWKPEKDKRFYKKKDREFQKEFIELFDKCVASALRSRKKTAILLSGGLDSTSVACFAAQKLKKKEEKLYSYTSVPEKDFVAKENPYYIVNEAEKVKETKEFLGNLECTFLELEGVNGFLGAREIMRELELPYKALQNIRWMYEAAKNAKKDGCSIMLTGQYGNATISFGDFEMHFYSLLLSGHFMELWKEIKDYDKNYHFGKKKVLEYLICGVRKNLSLKNLIVKELFKGVYVNPKLLLQFNTKKRFIKAGHHKDRGHAMTIRSFRPYMAYKIALVQLGEFETHLSLKTGVLLRDPTRDKRLITYCMKLPKEQFVYRGVDRKLIREYLREYLPPGICLDYKHKGLQSADMKERLSKNWKSIYKECEKILDKAEASLLLDVKKIGEKLKSLEKGIEEEEEFELMKLLYSLLLIEYVDG